MLERFWVRAAMAVAISCFCAGAVHAGEAALRIVAAENFYGDVARQIAGPKAHVVDILRNPDADPHLFETDAATARALAAADLVIYNGAGYDPWIERLLAGAPRSRTVMEVARLLPQASLDNPHLWYDPATMPALARVLSAALQRADPAGAAGYRERTQQFLASMRALDAQVAQLRARFAGVPVTATEPIADYLVGALGLTMRNRAFQLAIMNNTEPGARETAGFEQSLENRAVRVLIYNQQASDNAVQRLLAIARRSGVPIVGVSETEPPGTNYQQWMRSVVNALDSALSAPVPATPTAAHAS